MREAKRAYNVLRAFVNQEFERMKGVDILEAWRELDAAPGENKTETVSQPTTLNSSVSPNELEATA